MDHRRRELAPISSAAWRLLEDEARAVLRASLGARRLVPAEGPHGWDHSAVNLGRSVRLAIEPAAGVRARQRLVLGFVELRADFSLELDDLEDADRGADDLDLAPLEDAARQLAIAENVTVLQGYDEAGITGMTQASVHPRLALGSDVQAHPGQVAAAVAVLRSAGVDGPYGLALAPDAFARVVEAAGPGGILLLDHLQGILGGPVVRAPGLDGGVVASRRGGDFRLELGSDVSLGYAGQDETAVRLYLEESLAFRVVSPEAAVALDA